MIVARVRRSILERALLSRGERVLVACSGGPDSAALLHVLHRLAPSLGFELQAASVDHGLRPESAREVALAGELAHSLGVPFTPLSIEVPREGASLQAKARAARYAALLEQMKRIGAGALAVGHTRDDQAETVLARAIRGSGVLGLSGIEPRREDGVVRPLIDCARRDVHAYVARHALRVAADPSNVDPRYERVRIRRNVIPPIVAEEERALEHLAQLADDARALRDFVRKVAADQMERARLEPSSPTEARLDAEVLKAAPKAVRAELFSRWVRELTGATASRAHLEALERTIEGRGDCLLPGGWLVRLDERVVSARCEPNRRTRSRRGGPE